MPSSNGPVGLIVGVMFSLIAGFVVGLVVNFARNEREDEKISLEQKNVRLKEELRRAQSTGPGQSQDCALCMSQPLEVCLEPCGHVCCCRDCARKLSDKCPICRATVDRKRDIFIAGSR